MADVQEVLALVELVKRVQPFDRLYITNHGHTSLSGEREIVSKSDGTIYTRGTDRDHRLGYFQWPEDSEDYEVDLQRRVLWVYKSSHAYTGGRALVLTFSFGKGGPDAYVWCGTCRGTVARSSHTAH